MHAHARSSTNPTYPWKHLIKTGDGIETACWGWRAHVLLLRFPSVVWPHALLAWWPQAECSHVVVSSKDVESQPPCIRSRSRSPHLSSSRSSCPRARHEALRPRLRKQEAELSTKPDIPSPGRQMPEIEAGESIRHLTWLARRLAVAPPALSSSTICSLDAKTHMCASKKWTPPSSSVNTKLRLHSQEGCF